MAGNGAMQIESSYGGRCVARAVRTIQLALGLDRAALKEIEQPKLCNVRWITSMLQEQFPNRTAHIWCKDHIYTSGETIQYEGNDFSVFGSGSFDDKNHFVMFAFMKDDSGHMVVGLPVFGYDLEILIVIAIDTKKRDYERRNQDAD